MHVYFLKREPAARRLLQSRRLLAAAHAEAEKHEYIKIEQQLQAALAIELNLPVESLVPTTYVGKDQYHTTFLFKGLEAIEKGHQLEKAVLTNKFNPVAGHPIHRLIMEEIFSCGAHAAGATHPYKTNATWLIPDPTGHPSSTPTRSPTYNPSAAAVQAASCYYKHVSGCGGRCDSRSIYQCGGKEPANRVMGYDRWHNRYQSWELCRDLIVPDPDGMSQAEAKQCMSARCTNLAEFTLDKSNYGVNMAGPAQDACPGTVTAAPTGYPTEHPSSLAPTGGHPTNAPTDQPTTLPSAPPTRSPTVPPTAPPTRSPTVLPTRSPTPSPTYNPSAAAVQAGDCSGFFLKTSGRCTTNIRAMADCNKAAAQLGLSDRTATDDRQNGVTYDPPGCYFEGQQL
jgi:hypothetical protein